MVLSCCVCGVEYNMNVYRSFHTFPKNEDLKEQWFSAIGKKVTYQKAAVCSDHFLISNFTSVTGCVMSRRRLKKNTVPSVFQRNSQVDHTNNLHIISSEIMENSQADHTNDLHMSMTSEIVKNSQADHTNHMDKTKKRKLTTSLPSCKKFKVTINNQTEWLSRKDFTSQKSWEKFLYFVQNTRTHRNTVLHKNRRMKNRQETVENLLKTFKDKKLLSTEAEEVIKVGILLLQENINKNDILKDENLCLSDKNSDISNETMQSFFDHDYVSISDVTFNNYLDDIISYISGFVVKTINKKINCEICKKSLIVNKDEQPVSLLQRKKKYGNLISASKDVIRICKIAEKTVHHYKHNLNTENILQQMSNTALHLLPIGDLFLYNEHMFEQDPLADHRNQLIRLILHRYFQIRLYHETSSLQDTKNRIRSKNKKLVLFKDQ